MFFSRLFTSYFNDYVFNYSFIYLRFFRVRLGLRRKKREFRVKLPYLKIVGKLLCFLEKPDCRSLLYCSRCYESCIPRYLKSLQYLIVAVLNSLSRHSIFLLPGTRLLLYLLLCRCIIVWIKSSMFAEEQRVNYFITDWFPTYRHFSSFTWLFCTVDFK